VNYKEIILALTLYGQVHEDPACRSAAERVFNYAEKHNLTTK